MDLKEALKELDVTNDKHWTANGAPSVEVVAEIMKKHNLSRQDITEAFPMFSRTSEFKEAIVEAKASVPAELSKKAKLVELNEELAELTKEIKVLEVKRTGLEQQSAQLTLETAPTIAEIRQKHTDEQQKYIKKQGEIRMQKHLANQAILDAAGMPNANKSVLDQAMARKTKRGGQRPNLPLKKV